MAEKNGGPALSKRQLQALQFIADHPNRSAFTIFTPGTMRSLYRKGLYEPKFRQTTVDGGVVTEAGREALLAEKLKREGI